MPLFCYILFMIFILLCYHMLHSVHDMLCHFVPVIYVFQAAAVSGVYGPFMQFYNLVTYMLLFCNIMVYAVLYYVHGTCLLLMSLFCVCGFFVQSVTCILVEYNCTSLSAVCTGVHTVCIVSFSVCTGVHIFFFCSM